MVIGLGHVLHETNKHRFFVPRFSGETWIRSTTPCSKNKKKPKLFVQRNPSYPHLSVELSVLFKYRVRSKSTWFDLQKKNANQQPYESGVSRIETEPENQGYKKKETSTSHFTVFWGNKR